TSSGRRICLRCDPIEFYVGFEALFASESVAFALAHANGIICVAGIQQAVRQTTACNQIVFMLAKVHNSIVGVQPAMAHTAMVNNPRDVLTGPHSLLAFPFGLRVSASGFPALAPAWAPAWASWFPFQVWRSSAP